MAKELSQRFSNMEKALKSLNQKEELDTMTLEQLREKTIQFGKTKVGQTYDNVVKTDPGYCTWFLGSYGESTKASHQEFTRFLKLHTEFMEEALNLPSASGTLGTTAKSRAAPKAGYTKDMEKRGRSSSPISSLEDVEDEDWSRVAALENPQIGELHNRVSNMEAALTQIMQQLGQMQLIMTRAEPQ